jgi:hypothetical protein
MMWLLSMVQAGSIDWTALADKQLWGVLLGVIASGIAALAALGINQRMTLKANADESKRMSDAFTAQAERDDRRNERAMQLIENQQRIMTTVMSDLTSALNGVKEAVNNVATIVQDCPKSK